MMKVGDAVYKQRRSFGDAEMEEAIISGETPKYWRVDGELFSKAYPHRMRNNAYANWQLREVSEHTKNQFESIEAGKERKELIGSIRDGIRSGGVSTEDLRLIVAIIEGNHDFIQRWVMGAKINIETAAAALELMEGLGNKPF